MSTKLYVGNLSFSTSNEDLHELFSKVGTVESANEPDFSSIESSKHETFIQFFAPWNISGLLT